MSVHTAPGASVPSVESPQRGAATFQDIACRALDLVGSGVLLTLLAPLFAVIAVAVKLDSPGPAFFRQRRLGRDRTEFMIAKFRTMRHGADSAVHRDHVLALISENAPAPKLTADVRVTRLGRLLRRTSLDELPQLWNVLRGHMSLVGPRPPIPYEVGAYPPHWLARFAVKPGITGQWQVSGRSTVSLEEMIRMDVDYVGRRSVWLNLGILLRTVPAVLTTRGAG